MLHRSVIQRLVPRAPFRSLAARILQDSEQLSHVLESEGAGKKFIVLDWTASWCGPCKRISPLVDQLAEDHPDVLFLKVDVDLHTDAAQSAGIQAMPTFQFLQNKKVVAQFAGADASQLKEIVQTLKKE